MSQTEYGALLVAARKTGVSLIQYLDNRNSGLKWCSACKEWHKKELFTKDKSRYDGLSSVCALFRKKLYQESYVRKIRKSKKGCRYSVPRGGDKKQARHRINHLVEIGIIANPNSVSCVDCGHRGKDKRHEYHHDSYTIKNQEIVVCLCSECHHKRHGK